MLGDFIVLFLLILFGGFISASETVLIAEKNNIHKPEAKNTKNLTLYERLLKNENRLLSTTRSVTAFLCLLTGAYAANAFSVPMADFFAEIFSVLGRNVALGISFLLITVTLAYFYIVLDEFVIKRLAARHTAQLTNISVVIVYIVFVVARPLVALCTVSSSTLLRIMGINSTENSQIVTEDEIKMMLEVSEESGNIDENEKEMINNVFEFDNVSVDNISVHRRDIVALPIDAPKEEIIRAVTAERFTRIPLYEDNIDTIIGILYVRDFLNYILMPENYNNETIDLRKIMRKPFFVPISKKTDELFNEMQASKVHFAVIVDEYGGTAGIVTMEDIIEEIMGSILDEYDEEEQPEIEEIDESTFIISGTADLKMLSEYLGVKLPYDNYDTLSGFVIGQIGRIPVADEKPEFDFEGIIFKVLKVEDKRISHVIAIKAV